METGPPINLGRTRAIHKVLWGERKRGDTSRAPQGFAALSHYEIRVTA